MAHHDDLGHIKGYVPRKDKTSSASWKVVLPLKAKNMSVMEWSFTQGGPIQDNKAFDDDIHQLAHTKGGLDGEFLKYYKCPYQKKEVFDDKNVLHQLI